MRSATKLPLIGDRVTICTLGLALLVGVGVAASARAAIVLPNWKALKEEKKFDVLVGHVQQDMRASPKNTQLQLSGAMLLAEIYTLHLVDFQQAKFWCGRAEELNERMFGADYEANVRQIDQWRVTQETAKGRNAQPVWVLGTKGEVEELTFDAFRLQASDQAHSRALLRKLEVCLSTNSLTGTDTVTGRLLAAAVVTAHVAEDRFAANQHLDRLRDFVNRFEKELAHRAEHEQRDVRRSRWKHASNIGNGVVSYALMGSVVYITAGLVLFSDTDRNDLLHWEAQTRGNIVESRKTWSRSVLLAQESAFARGLNLFISYQEQLALFEAAGWLELGRSNPSQAITYFEQGIALLEQMRTTLSQESDRIAYLGVRNGLYYGAIDSLMVQGRSLEALQFTERARCRAFLDVLAQGELRFADVEAQNFLDQLRETQSEISLLLSQRALGDVQKQALLEKVRNLAVRAEQTSRFKDILVLNSMMVPEVAGIAPTLDADTCILSYFITQNHVWGWSITRAGVSGLELPLTPAEAANLCRQHYRAASSPTAQPDGRTSYERFIAPLLGQRNCRKLLFIPHRDLHLLSFAALDDGQGNLNASRQISLCPSIAAWLLIQQRGEPRTGSLLCVAVSKGEKLALAGAAREAQAICTQYERAELLLDDACDKSVVLQKMPGHAVIHFACHGVFNLAFPLESALILGNTPDRRLRAGEFYGLKLDRATVVLSACDTAREGLALGDERIGLLRPLFYAGTSRVVAGLWKVEDEATSRLMTVFHQRLAQGTAASEALRQAQWTLSQEPRFRHPVYWAAFCTYGGF